MAEAFTAFSARRLLCCVAAASLLSLIALPVARAGQPVIDYGDRGALVADWQRALRSYLRGSGDPATRRLQTRIGDLAADGVFGRKTLSATTRFQHEAHIRVTGAVDLDVWKAWIGANVSCCGAGYPVLVHGQTSAYVGWWQVVLDRWLVRHASNGIVVDTVFGPRTTDATRVFQRAAKLAPSGTVNAQTWRALAHTRGGIGL